MQTNLPSEYRILKESFRAFLKKEILPFIDEWEKEHRCPREVFEKMGRQGYFGLTFPEEVGGSAMSFHAAAILAEQMAFANMGGLAMSLYAHAYLPCPAISALGTELQKQKYLIPAIRGEKIGGLAITEPGAGSDVGGIQSTAEDKGDHYLLNGSKTYITNGHIADFLLVAVRTGEGHQLSLLLLDRHTEGFSSIPLDHKLGMHSSDTGQLFFENCRIPKEQRLGEEHFGFYYIMNNFQEERLLAAVSTTHAAEWALEKAKVYCTERKAFGRNISRFQAVSHLIAQMAVDVEACRSITYRAVDEFIEKGPEAVRIVTMAKAFSTETAFKVINQAMQLFGGAGYMEDYGIARAFRDVRLFNIGAGTTQIMHEIISKLEFGELKSDKVFIGHR